MSATETRGIPHPEFKDTSSSSGHAVNMSLHLLCIPLQLTGKIYSMIFQRTDFQSNHVTTGKHTYKSTFEKHLPFTHQHGISNALCSSEQPEHVFKAMFYSLTPFCLTKSTLALQILDYNMNLYQQTISRPLEDCAHTKCNNLRSDVSSAHTTSLRGAGKEGADSRTRKEQLWQSDSK